MGFLDSLLGNDAATASRSAAADTYAKQLAATNTLQGQGANYATNLGNLGQNYATSFGDLAKGYQPWINTGQGANTSLQQLLANPGSISSLPGYQFDLAQGTRALDHSALANGNLFSGKQGKALVNYGTNLADKTYGDQISRLLGISNQGLGAQGQANALTGQGISGGIGLQAQGLQGQLGADTSAYGGNLSSAGTIGQGDVAAANAKAKGTQNLVNLAGTVAGAALGGGFGGGFGGMGGALGSLFGGSPSYGGGTFLDSAYGGSRSNPLAGLTAADYG